MSEDGLRVAGEDIERLVTDGWDALVERLFDAVPQAPSEWLTVARRFQRTLPPSATLLDRVRATVVAIAAADPLRGSARVGVRRRASQLLATMVEALPLVGQPYGGRLSDRLWCRLSKDRRRLRRDALDSALVLLTDHGLATSTFAVRVAASTRCDLYSAILAGLATIGGPLHGAASAAMHDLYLRAEQADVATAVGEARARGALPGVGHSVYRRVDPREALLFGALRDAYDISLVDEVRVALGREHLVNVDAALGALTYLARMPRDSGEGIFAVARSVGWVLHYLEELEEEPLRFRPRARYVEP